MRYLQQSFKADKGIRVQVTFDRPTRILLLSRNEYKKYKGSASFTYYGGEAKDSPKIITVPKAGLWYVVVEIGGYHENGSYNASVALLAKENPGEKRQRFIEEARKAKDPETARIESEIDLILAGAGKESSEEETSEEVE